MSSKTLSLEEENKKLKKKINFLEKQVFQLSSKTRPASGRVTKTPEDFNKSIQSKNKHKLDESSIEKNSKESWSKLINTDLEILQELKCSSAKTPNIMKIINEKNYGFDVEPKSILNELSSLKEENKLLKMQLKKKNSRLPRSESRNSRKLEENLNETSKNSRTKYCKVCVKLLTKGYTTRFCPVHGHNLKSSIKSYLT